MEHCQFQKMASIFKIYLHKYYMNFFDFYKIVNLNSSRSKPIWEETSDGFRGWLVSEVSQSIANELEDWQEEHSDELPFHSLFNKSENEGQTTRITIPFQTDSRATGILDKINEAGMTIDYDKSTVSDGKRSIRLGKFVLSEKSPFTPEEKSWWNRSGNPVAELEATKNKNNFAIIVSRNPIDIVRMSDHDGWSSCHAPSREYFQCALSDAKGAGAVAYVVKKEDLKNINLKSPEIFRDKKRNIQGITPISRVRLRKFVHKKENYDLAVPEDRIYGKTFPGLKESVRLWALKNQQDKLNGKRVRLKDFKLMGGSYQDTLGSDLFNYFFDDDLDSGEAEYGGSDEYSNMFDQYEEEVYRIKREYENEFSICNFYAEVEESDGQPYVHYGGNVNLEIPEHLMLKDKLNYRSNNIFNFQNMMRRWANDNDIYDADHVEINGNEIVIIVYGNGHDPDSFREFLEELANIDNNAHKLQSSLYNLFVEQGLAKQSLGHEIGQNIEEHQLNFMHFDLEQAEPEILISLKDPIQFPLPEKSSAGYQHEYGYWQGKFKENLINQLDAWAERILQNKKKQLLLFNDPGLQPQRPFSSEFNILPNIKIFKPTYRDYLAMQLEIEFHPLTKDNHVEDAMNFIKFLDNNYSAFVQLVQNTYKQWISQWAKANTPTSSNVVSTGQNS